MGHGFDAHAFEDGRALVIGGVRFDESYGLGGHSDGDVLSHAIADAILGACSLGDLGQHFPASDRWKDASSLEILAEAGRLAGEADWSVVNVDATVIATRPKLAPQREAMIANIAETLGIERGAVSVKATTTDGMGFTGRGEGIAALVNVLVEH